MFDGGGWVGGKLVVGWRGSVGMQSVAGYDGVDKRACVCVGSGVRKGGGVWDMTRGMEGFLFLAHGTTTVLEDSSPQEWAIQLGARTTGSRNSYRRTE